MKFKKHLILVAIFYASAASAQELQGKFQDWNVFKTERGDRVVCYLASTPIKRDGNYDKRGESFFLVTNIENDADEISTSSGFIYNKNSNVEVSFGSRKFYLFPHKAIAWANDKNDDIDVIKEMQKHDDMTISGVAFDGKISTDTYSLVGFVQAYKKMKEVCEDDQ
jgi:invasion protein IalB